MARRTPPVKDRVGPTTSRQWGSCLRAGIVSESPGCLPGMSETVGKRADAVQQEGGTLTAPANRRSFR
eukprot:3197722-Pyramimonas_sp.AAC.1